VAASKSGNTFTIVKDPTTGISSRTCTGSSGGCKAGTW
jgi:hypothetical protein